jgi:hypothetical protein
MLVSRRLLSLTDPFNYEQIPDPSFPLLFPFADKASPDDPQELSFAKGEILHVADDTGKWWQCRKSDGSMGICPSNCSSFLLCLFPCSRLCS